MTTIIVDTREQRPWTFEGQPGITLARAKLDAGDYSVKGLEHRVAIERKSFSDLIGTIFRARARFYRELERLRAFEFRCVIVEAGIREIYEEATSGFINAKSVMGLLAEIAVSQRVPVYLAGTRPEAQLLAGAFLKMADKKYNEAGADA